MGQSQGSPQMWKVEMGAAYSMLNNFSGPLSSDSCQVIGVSGKPSIRFTPPLCYLWDQTAFPHPFLVMSECPILLLGKNTLSKLGAQKFNTKPISFSLNGSLKLRKL